MSRPRPILENLFFCYEILFMSRPRLIETRKFCGCRDRDSSRLGNSLVVETETHRDWEILWLSRPRLIETGKFCGCRDRDSSRLGNSVVVETETHRDWEFLWLSRPRPAETEQKLSRPRLHRESRWSLKGTWKIWNSIRSGDWFKDDRSKDSPRAGHETQSGRRLKRSIEWLSDWIM